MPEHLAVANLQSLQPLEAEPVTSKAKVNQGILFSLGFGDCGLRIARYLVEEGVTCVRVSLPQSLHYSRIIVPGSATAITTSLLGISSATERISSAERVPAAGVVGVAGGVSLVVGVTALLAEVIIMPVTLAAVAAAMGIAVGAFVVAASLTGHCALG